MQTPEQKAIWRHAQTLSFMGFLALGAALIGLWTLLDHVSGKGLRGILEGAIYVACFFAVFTIQPMTHYFYARLIRR